MSRAGGVVDGVPAASATFASTDPATGDVIAEFPVDDAAAVQAKVTLAREASAWWRELGFGGRAEHLRRWRERIWADVGDLCGLLHRENGKTRDDALIEVVLTVEHMRWTERHAAAALRPARPSPGLLFANYSARIEYEPCGVVGVVGPWNYPLYSLNSTAAYALAAGNTVVMKPSEYTPSVAARYVDAFYDANPAAPRGVLEMTTGFGDTGAALCTAGVDKVGFTGSTGTGRKIIEQCARTLTPMLLECGGKDPVIVADDADIVAAARAIAWGGFANAGQTCIGVERVYVVASRRQELLTALQQELSGIRPGSGPGADYGPMTMPGQADVVRRHAESAGRSGGTFLLGAADSVGERYIRPIVVVDAAEDCAAVTEETFGPMITVRTVRGVDEAVASANAGEYGLSASVFSRRRGQEIAARLRAGQVSVNAVIAFAGMGSVPMGGVGGSGFGRVHGADGLREFTRPRAVVEQRFAIPGFELLSLHRRRYTMPLLRWAAGLRHRGGFSRRPVRGRPAGAPEPDVRVRIRRAARESREA